MSFVILVGMSFHPQSRGLGALVQVDSTLRGLSSHVLCVLYVMLFSCPRMYHLYVPPYHSAKIWAFWCLCEPETNSVMVHIRTQLSATCRALMRTKGTFFILAHFSRAESD